MRWLSRRPTRGRRNGRAGPTAGAWLLRQAPVVVPIFGLLTTCGVTVALWRSNEARDHQRFLHAADVELRTIADQMRTYTALLRGAAGLFAANADVSRASFKAYVDRLDLEQRYPGILGVGFTPFIPSSDVPRLVAAMHQQGVSDYQVRPTPRTPYVAPVVFAEPENRRNQAAIGYDVSSEPDRREMLERARSTGMTAVSGRIELAQEIDDNKQAGFLMATPVYRGGTVPSTVEERRAAFAGFIFGAFRADDLFRDIVPAMPQDDVALAVYDGAPGAATLLHRSAAFAQSMSGVNYTQNFDLEVGGRSWTVVFTSRVPTSSLDIWFICGGGLLATGLLTFAAEKQRRAQHVVQRLNRSLERRVEERTQELQLLNTRLVRASSEREAVEEQLRQAQKMEAVGQLTGGLAHDFNNLLTGISGSLELLQTRVAQGRTAELGRYITAAQEASRRAAALTHRLLAFSRRQTLDPRPTDVSRLVAGMDELIRRTVGPAVEVEVVGTVGLWTVLVDPNQLENALLNLCINARDAMPGGGHLRIETGNVELDERGAREHELRTGEYITLCVSDTGTGMSPEVIQRAFEPFFTTKPIGMGTGLGLSMIYGFVQQSGGQACIRSEPGQGATICLYLPRHSGDAESAAERASRVGAARALQGETVLVVDDEPTVRMLITEVLEELGYAAVEAVDGPAGLKVLQSDVRLDLLITDVGLPGGMNGRQVADAARMVRPGLKVLFITGYAENAVLSQGQLEPGMHVLTKPFTMDTLASRVKELSAGV